MLGLRCSLWPWLLGLAVNQQVCTWGSFVSFCVSFLSFHLAWLLLLSLPAAVSLSALLCMPLCLLLAFLDSFAPDPTPPTTRLTRQNSLTTQLPDLHQLRTQGHHAENMISSSEPSGNQILHLRSVKHFRIA